MPSQRFSAGDGTPKFIELAGDAASDKTKIRDALKKVAFTGARGAFKFDQKGDPTHSAGMIVVKGGKDTDANE